MSAVQRSLTFEEDIVLERGNEDNEMKDYDALSIFEPLDANVEHLTRFSSMGSAASNPF